MRCPTERARTEQREAGPRVKDGCMGTLPTETLRSTRVRWREVCLRVRFLEGSEISLDGHLSRCSEVSLASSGSAVGSVTSQGLRRTATRPQAQHATAVSSDHGSETRPTAFASSHPSCAFGSPSARLSVSREPCPSIRRTEVRCLVGQYYQQQIRSMPAPWRLAMACCTMCATRPL